ncbi:MAG: NUDIX domain-containing protein [bacterium]
MTLNNPQKLDSPRLKLRHERSAGAIVYRKKGRTILVYLQLDSFHKWAAPKGRIQATETDEVAALRELEEETGMKDGQIEGDLGMITLKFKRKNFLVKKNVHYFLVRVPWNSQVILQRRTSGRGERLYGYRWVPLKKAPKVSDYENMQPVIKLAGDLLTARFGKDQVVV